MPHRTDPRKSGEQGFALVEMLVAMLLLSLVGLTLAQFQGFQAKGLFSARQLMAARLLADHQAVGLMVAPRVTPGLVQGAEQMLGEQLHWSAETRPGPANLTREQLVQIEIAVRLGEDGPVVARRHLLRPEDQTTSEDEAQKQLPPGVQGRRS